MKINKAELEIREAGKRELYSITILTRKFFTYTNFNMQKILKRMKNPKVHYLVALYDGHTIGYVDFTENKKSIRVMGLAVLEEFQGNGIGKALLKEAIRFARKVKKENVHLLVSADNMKALNMYGKLGFKSAGKLNRKLYGKTIYLLRKKLRK